MAEDSDLEKTEEPTPKRLEEARKEGDVVTSREVNAWFGIAALLTYLWLILPYFGEGVVNIIRLFIEQPHQYSVTKSSMAPLLTVLWESVLYYLMIPLGLFVIVAVASNVMQHGFLYTTKSLKPKFSKISPKSGIKKIISMRSIVEFAKGLVKLSIVGFLAYLLLVPEFQRISRFVDQEVIFTMQHLQWIVILLVSLVLAVFAIFAALDFAYQKYEYMKKLRMTKQQVKDEMKQSYGDPHVKGRIRKIRTERARERMMAAVPKADVVITNPTHFAIALAYQENQMDAPTIVAKGQDLVALRIKEIAKENDVVTVENKPLARALYAFDINEQIPPEHYKAVAEIIRYVWAIKGKNANV